MAVPMVTVPMVFASAVMFNVERDGVRRTVPESNLRVYLEVLSEIYTFCLIVI